MQAFSPTIIKELLAKHGLRPSKGLGQNFLIDKNALDKIIGAANLHSTDTVVEVGPGIGTLTQALSKKAKRVVTIEKDHGMVAILQETLKDIKNVEVIHGDALSYKVHKVSKVYKVVANIPYYITSPLIRALLEAENPPTEIILMVQKEVAQRIVARPPNMSILAVSVQFYADAKIISYVPKGCFWPVPNVDSAIIAIRPRNRAESDAESRGKINPDDFFKVVKAGFMHPRKQLAGNLSETLKVDKKGITEWLLKNNIQPAQRAETLTIEDWKNLTNDGIIQTWISAH